MLCPAQLLLSYERNYESLIHFFPAVEQEKTRLVSLQCSGFQPWDPGKPVQELGVAELSVTETQKYGNGAISWPCGCLRYFTWISKSCQGVVAHVCNPSWRQRQENREFFVSVKKSRTAWVTWDSNDKSNNKRKPLHTPKGVFYRDQTRILING